MNLEEDLAEGSTSSCAASTNHMSQATPPGASESLRCPICLDATNDRASASWCSHPVCFSCLVEWFHRRVVCPICQWSFPHNFHTVGDTNSGMYSTGQYGSSDSRAQGGRAGLSSEERKWYRSSGRQHHNSFSRSRGGTRGGRRGGTRGGRRGSRHGGVRERNRSRYQRRHHDGHGRVQQAQGYNRSSRRRRQQSRAQNTARGNGRAPRTKQHIRAASRRCRRRQQGPRVSFMEPQVTRSRFRQRSRSTVRQTLRENLRRMERDEGRALRHEWHIQASSRRNEHRQHRRQLSYREPQVTRNRPRGRSRNSRHQTLRENPRRVELDERGFLRIERAVPPSSRRSQRRQRERRVSFIEPRATRRQTRGTPRSTRRQTLRENLRRMERDEGRALRLERDVPTSSGWSEHRQQGHQVYITEPQPTRN
ncbi:zinc finger CCCH domain-containing protein 13-like [Neopelma chrysocephalum]|uniref:zinc finger CCCH domain-containing protein 13-like n=1 Tax=Neopelma chrysocephalum TaxID=114329 RepID=UPI000FCD08C4|nr:zinc finger CCCH domain-containing protein 13-like [Neopelma chrysocephalum]XP_027528908.1 zinc finger CCCH domain-containing protein 13-like [Neopelma chrysocephalum]XP_027551802.1 zinc finger CCCH domain-containing protein 13-like [Neopelma chrysocephalum]